MTKKIKLLLGTMAISSIIAPIVALSSCNHSTPPIVEPEQENIDKINAILAKTKCYTMSEALSACKSTIDIEKLETINDHQYVWDQLANQFIVMDKTDAIVVASSGYKKNHNKWQLWKMVYPSESGETKFLFNPKSQYSQYIRSIPELINADVRINVIVSSGFDCGEYTDQIESIEYMGEGISRKDLLIRTNSYKTNVTINEDKYTTSELRQYGKMGGLDLNQNHKFTACGEILTANISCGSLSLEDSSNAKIDVIEIEKEGCSLSIPSLASTKILATNNTIISKTNFGTGKTGQVATANQIKQAKIEITNQNDGTFNEILLVYDNNGKTVDFYKSFTELSEASNNPLLRELFANKTIKLSKNYDMTDESADWEPICNDLTAPYTHSFKGTFDGRNHTISNFKVIDTTNSIALFGSSSGDLKNVIFKNGRITSKTVGGCSLLAINLTDKANINNIHAESCEVNVAGSAGLIVSWIDDSVDETTQEGKADTKHIISNCSADSRCYTRAKGGNQCGGIIGQCCFSKEIIFENIQNHGQVIGHGSAGGVLGQYGFGVVKGTFTNCVNNGAIQIDNKSEAGGSFIGGITGWHNNTGDSPISGATVKYDHCTNNGNVTSIVTDESTSVIAGGICGYSYQNFSVSFSDCTNNGYVGLLRLDDPMYKCAYAGGLLGFSNNETLQTYYRSTNAGHIYSFTACGHLTAHKLDDSIQKATLTNISHGMILPPIRVRINGEPVE